MESIQSDQENDAGSSQFDRVSGDTAHCCAAKNSGGTHNYKAIILVVAIFAASLLHTKAFTVTTALRPQISVCSSDTALKLKSRKSGRNNTMTLFMADDVSMEKSFSSTRSSGTVVIEPKQKSKKHPQPLGRWEELHGNYLLRPQSVETQPRALLHFIGGALVGDSPHLCYRYMLERLADRGYLVVATPFHLSFDYIETCDAIIGRFERIAPMLAQQYGPVPVVGVGHSCGAVLHTLITSLFPDTPRAANALISFNNKPVKEAVPFFDEVFAPLFTALASKNDDLPSGTEGLKLMLELARTATEGELPSEELLEKASKILTPSVLKDISPAPGIPDGLRPVLQTIIEPQVNALDNAGVLPLLNQFVNLADQIPLIINEVADGARDFVPPPEQVQMAAKRAYRARRTLILQYDNDGLDESELLEELLLEAESVTRMKRPMIDVDVQRKVLSGGHATPLLAPPLNLVSKAEDILGKETAMDALFYAQADATVDALVQWLEEVSL